MTKAALFDLDDPGRREKYSEVSLKIIGILRKEFASPLEAYGVLILVKEGFEEIYGIEGSRRFGKDEVGHA